MGIKTFGVIGAGQMGGGIAQVAAASGLEVIMSDINEECTAKGVASIEKKLVRSVEKGKLETEQARETLGRIRTTTDISDMAQADYVVEAAVEMEDLEEARDRTRGKAFIKGNLDPIHTLLEGTVDAVVTFEPQRTQLEKAGYRVLFDSRQIPGRIVDVLAVRSAALRRQGPALRELLSGYFRALEYLAVDPQGAHRRMGQRLEVPAEDSPAMLTGIRLPDEAENRELLHGTPAPLNRSAAKLIGVMRRADILADI